MLDSDVWLAVQTAPMLDPLVVRVSLLVSLILPSATGN